MSSQKKNDTKCILSNSDFHQIPPKYAILGCDNRVIGGFRRKAIYVPRDMRYVIIHLKSNSQHPFGFKF